MQPPGASLLNNPFRQTRATALRDEQLVAQFRVQLLWLACSLLLFLQLLHIMVLAISGRCSPQCSNRSLDDQTGPVMWKLWVITMSGWVVESLLLGFLSCELRNSPQKKMLVLPLSVAFHLFLLLASILFYAEPAIGGGLSPRAAADCFNGSLSCVLIYQVTLLQVVVPMCVLAVELWVLLSRWRQLGAGFFRRNE